MIRAGKSCTRCVRTFGPESRTFEDILGRRSRTFVAIFGQELRIGNSRLRKYWGWWLGFGLKIEEVLRMSRLFFVENHTLLRTFQKPQNFCMRTFWAFFHLWSLESIYLCSWLRGSAWSAASLLGSAALGPRILSTLCSKLLLDFLSLVVFW